MASGVGLSGGAIPPIGAPPGGGNFKPTVPEIGGAAAGGGGAPQIGGAASTVHEDQQAGIPQAGGLGGGARTMFHEEVGRPLAGWLVVLRSREMAPYQEIPIFSGKNKLGRDPSYGNQCISDANASSEHAMIMAEEGKVELMDLGSGNGTKLNNQLVPRTADISPGDMIRIGKTTMVFVEMPQVD